MKTISKSRQHLLSTAGTLVALLLAVAPAHAQQASPEASGNSVLVNDQSASGFTHADASNPGAGSVITGPMIDSTVSVRDNSLAASARANRATMLLAPDPLGVSAAFDTPVLTTGSGGVAARAGTVIASRQTMTAAEVDGDILDTTLRLEAGVVSRSALALSDNGGDTLALGNDAVSEIRLGGPGSGATAGIANEQRMGPGSDVTARAWSGTDLATLSIARTSLANSDNLARSVARGNASENRVVAEVSALAENPAVEAPSLVSSSGNAEVTALFAVLGNQTVSGVVRAMAGNRLGGPVFGTAVDGTADVAAITSDGNALGAAAYGNSSANALDLKAGSITTTPASVDLPNFAIANVTGVQRSDALIVAQTLGGTDVQVSGTLTASDISASSNSTRTTATGNLASGNLLTVESNSAGPSAFAAQVPGGRVDSAGMMEFWSPLGVQNAQTSSGAVSASHSGGTRISIGGSLQQSALDVEGNDQLVAATGNAATNGARVEAVQLGTAVGVNSYQTGDGDVRATLGSTIARSDASIAGGLVRGSDLSVSGNEATGIATGNRVSNTLTVESGAIGPGTARWLNWTAYANALGAYAGTALASTQRLGTAAGSEGPLRVVSSTVTGGAAISGGIVAESSLAINGNVQRAQALGNLASNRILVSTNSYTGYAGSAVSSSQVARAALTAFSDANFGLTGTLSGTTASISGNTNLALAEMNDADNAIGVETVHATGSLPYAAIDGSGRAVIGDQVLDSWQQAQGSVQAIATARFEAEGLGLSGATLEIDGNSNSAEATANRAVNQSSITTTGTVPVSGLASAQFNSATVGASARTLAGAMPGSGIGASSLTVSDNTTSAIARANSSDNLLTAQSPIGSAVTSTVAGIGGRVEAPAAVLNRQVNNGAILATAFDSGYGLLPSSAPSASVGNIAITGNSVAAAAYGNVASSIINAPGLGQPPAGAIANFQTNSGPVNALVGRTSLGGGAGAFSGSGLSISGNNLAATAVGNQASSAIVGPR